MKRVLVTGASGFIGSQTLAHLENLGFEVHAAPLRSRIANTPASVSWHECDFFEHGETTALIDLIRPSHLLHCAWITEHGQFWNSPLNTSWLNASQSLLRAFHTAGGRRFVGVGSCAEYDWNDSRIASGTCHEMTTQLNPRTLYGQTKKELCEWAGDLCRRDGMEFGWARLFSIYGRQEDSRRLVPSVIQAILAGQRAAIGPGNLVRDFLHANDIGRALAILVDADTGGAVNVASGHALSIAELCRRIADLMEARHALDIGALPERSGEPPRLVADVGRLTHEFGFTPAIGLDEGLLDAIKWWRNRSTRKI